MWYNCSKSRIARQERGNGVFMEQETYLERIKMLKSQRKLTNDRLSELTGIPLGTLSKLLAGISDSPKLSNIVAISRALDCSLDWLITGVPENTHNYTLEPAEITLVESYRALDDFGRDLALTVIQKESARAERQSDERAILLHDLARRTARRGGARLHTAPEETVAEPAAPAVAAPTTASAPQVTAPVVAAPVAAAPIGAAPEVPVAPTPETAAPASAQILSIPKSVMDRQPAGLRRRSIGLYDMPVSAGVGEFLADSARTDILIPDDPRTAEADYALRINGDSMEPKYHSGDVILIQTAEAVEEGELGIFVLDGSGYFKKYGGDHLISLNQKYPPIRLRDFDSVACCGRVVGKLKRK